MNILTYMTLFLLIIELNNIKKAERNIYIHVWIPNTAYGAYYI